MTIRAWKSEYHNPYDSDRTPKDATFAVAQPAEKTHAFSSGWAGTTIDVTAPSYRNNFQAQRTNYRNTNPGERDRSTLFDYVPGKVTGMFNDVRTPHTAGIAMGLAAQWHRTQGGERNVGHGMPTYDQSLSSDSAPIAKRLATRGMVPSNEDNPDAVATNELGRSGERGTRTHEIFPEDYTSSRGRGVLGSTVSGEVGPEEMRGARETLREVFGRKRTATIQPHPQKSQGEQLRLV